MIWYFPASVSLDFPGMFWNVLDVFFSSVLACCALYLNVLDFSKFSGACIESDEEGKGFAGQSVQP